MTITCARKLRRTMTLPEVLLWKHLRARPSGLKFRRQHPLGSYILDFYNKAAALAIEVDGLSHDTGTKPQRGDSWLHEIVGRGC